MFIGNNHCFNKPFWEHTETWYDISKSTKYFALQLSNFLYRECQLAIFTSVTEALNSTKHCISKSNREVWIKLASCVIHITRYQMSYKTLSF
jgi:hypothetical protein